MSDDLVKRLRATCSCNIDNTPCLAEEECRVAQDAADRIEELEAKLAKARTLVEIAYRDGFAEGYDGGWIGGYYLGPWKKSEARASLAELKGEK